MPQKNTTSAPSLGFWGLFSIGMGGMVGGSLFAVLGIASLKAQGATPLAFLLAGLIALLTSYSYVKLSLAIPGIGGTVSFLNEAFGLGSFTGALNVLLILSYVVGMSVNAHAVANYGLRFFPPGHPAFWKPVLMTGTVVLLTGINALGPRLVIKSEFYSNILKLLILITFVLGGLGSVQYSHLSPATWSSSVQIVSGAMTLILCFQGFELMANASKDVKNPHRILPRTFYSSIGIAILLYVLIAVVALGNLPLSEIEKNSGSALAEAAKPFLGSWGISLMAVAAVVAAASAINASLYGTARISFILSKRGQLPHALTKMLWHRPIEGLIVVALFTVLVANFLDLESISLLASAGFLLVYAAVNLANLKLRRRSQSHWLVPSLALIFCLGALITTLLQTWGHSPRQVLQLIGMLALVFFFEWIYQRKAGIRHRASMDAVEKETESPAPH
jgi:Amino acid transporters